MTNKKIISSSIVAASIIAFDQATKYFAPTWFSTIVCNSGFAFGAYQGFLNGLIAALVLLGLIYIFVKNSSSDILFGLALVIGGGMSNLTDRLVRGCVVDFIDLKFWPAFNLADAAITIGVVILILSLLKTFKSPEVQS